MRLRVWTMSRYDDVLEAVTHPGEPVFVLRGQDVLAPLAVQAYAGALRAAAAGALLGTLDAEDDLRRRLLESARECDEIAARMVAWQAGHGGKLPD